jgi:hypothetical protein
MRRPAPCQRPDFSAAVPGSTDRRRGTREAHLAIYKRTQVKKKRKKRQEPRLETPSNVPKGATQSLQGLK